MTSTPLKKHPRPLLQQSSHTWHSHHRTMGAGSGHQRAVGTGSKFPQHSTSPIRRQQSLHPAEENIQL